MLMYQVTLYVQGMTCFDSFQLIENEIKGLYGIISFKISLLKGKIVIKFKPRFVSTMEIVKKLEDQGFSILKKVQQEYYHEIYN